MVVYNMKKLYNKKKKSKLYIHIETKNREKAKEQGFYDGRFKTKIIRNKKKEAIKKLSRKKWKEHAS
jgi:hypothetical protein